MKSISLTLKFGLAVFFFLGLAGLPGHSWGVEYTLTPFGVPDITYAFGISSNNDTIVGSGGYVAFLKNGASVTTPVGDVFSQAYGISPNGGQVVGYDGSSGASFSYQTSTASASSLSLSTAGFNPGIYAGARGVNDSGTIVGQDNSQTKSFIMASNGTPVTLDFGSNWSNILAYGINNSGVIVGQGTFGGSTEAFRTNGQVNLTTGLASAEFLPLELLGITQTTATGINGSNQIVGWGKDGGGNTVSFVCDGNGCKVVTSTGWSLLELYGINDKGTIVGVGQSSKGQEAFTGVSAVPVPAPLLLLSSGLAIVAGLRKRFKR